MAGWDVPGKDRTLGAFLVENPWTYWKKPRLGGKPRIPSRTASDLVEKPRDSMRKRHACQKNPASYRVETTIQ
jgi:hypothetical protein